MNTNYRWYESHMAYIDAKVIDLEAYLMENGVLDQDEADEEIKNIREAIEIHINAFRIVNAMTGKDAEALRKYADGSLTAALARWELEHRY